MATRYRGKPRGLFVPRDLQEYNGRPVPAFTDSGEAVYEFVPVELARPNRQARLERRSPKRYRDAAVLAGVTVLVLAGTVFHRSPAERQLDRQARAQTARVCWLSKHGTITEGVIKPGQFPEVPCPAR